MNREEYLEIYRRLYSKYFDQLDANYTLLERHGLLDGCRSVLSIGGGEGQLEIRLATTRGVTLGYVDGSRTQGERFLDRARRANVQQQIVECHLGKFETFTPVCRYDLVLAIQSWGGVGFERQAIEKAFSALAPGGRFFVVLPSEHDELRQIFVRQRYATAERLSAWANEESLEHEFFHQITRIPADGLLHDGELTPDAKHFVTFRGRRQWEALTGDEQSRIRRLFANAEARGYLERTSGCLILRPR